MQTAQPAASAPFRMSEVISHLAEPIVAELGDTPEDIERIITLTIAAWNLTLFPPETQEDQLARLFRKHCGRDLELAAITSS